MGQNSGSGFKFNVEVSSTLPLAQAAGAPAGGGGPAGPEHRGPRPHPGGRGEAHQEEQVLPRYISPHRSDQ